MAIPKQGFQALREAAAPVAGLEPSVEGFLQISRWVCYPLCLHNVVKHGLLSSEIERCVSMHIAYLLLWWPQTLWYPRRAKRSLKIFKPNFDYKATKDSMPEQLCGDARPPLNLVKTLYKNISFLSFRRQKDPCRSQSDFFAIHCATSSPFLGGVTMMDSNPCHTFPADSWASFLTT
ncbi:hypothetical protein PoB_006086600 [Plakobranchus ocellatus]|uniref:Uncharacterized protein n=1 Tax=Plakobranchus ocellatus TaxID=259542 RepID=A0AAV4CR37_9GAST|nr:hypothetical protein PoB_006086600 [Plakobranchus ocellatus]